MPRKTSSPLLIGGPYAAPRCRVGGRLTCEIRGDVAVAGLTDAPIQWPYHHGTASRRSLVVCGDLATAVRTEAGQAVARLWGVDRKTVQTWRRALGVGRMTPGTLARWQALTPCKLTRARRVRGGKAAAAKRYGTK